LSLFHEDEEEENVHIGDHEEEDDDENEDGENENGDNEDDDAITPQTGIFFLFLFSKPN
jgi:hypothetical protein